LAHEGQKRKEEIDEPTGGRTSDTVYIMRNPTINSRIQRYIRVFSWHLLSKDRTSSNEEDMKNPKKTNDN